jgi:hypothetical protein
MQTFDLPPSSHTASTRNRENNFSPEKPAATGERFDHVMDRALTESPRDSNRKNETSATEKPVRKDSNRPAASPTKHPAASNKPLRATLAKSDAATAPAMAMPPNVPPVSKPAETPEGASDESSPAEDEKAKHAVAGGNSGGSPITGAQLLTTPGPLTISTASPTPVSPAISKDADARHASKTTAEDRTASGAPARSDAKSPASAPATTDGSPSAADPPAGEAELAGPPANPAPVLQDIPADKAKGSLEIPSVPAPDAGGTSAAKHYLTMKKADKTPKVAGPAEQDLPGDPASVSEELPKAQKITTPASLHAGEKLESTITIEPAAAARISASPETANAVAITAAASPAMPADSRLRVLERTHDIVALHAMRLGESGSDSLHVVIKPGAGVQLSLELRQNEGGIEVRASLHKGDFGHLSQYWPELQQRLEARGVRVGTLTCSENCADSGQQQFQQSKQQPSPDQDPLHAGAFAEFALAGSLREAPAARAARTASYRGWETWA